MNSHDTAERSHLQPYYKLACIQKIPYAYLGGAVPPPKEVAEPGKRISGLEETIADLRDELDMTLSFLVPPKTVGLWSGSLDEVPTGWALCDG